MPKASSRSLPMAPSRINERGLSDELSAALLGRAAEKPGIHIVAGRGSDFLFDSFESSNRLARFGLHWHPAADHFASPLRIEG
jgi:hypothetical protein